MRGVRQDAGINPKGKRAVVLGAGGAARAIVTELALAGVAELVVVNRSSERGETMAAELADKTGASSAITVARPYTVPGDADLLVNATSIGLYPNVHDMPPVDLQRRATGTAGLRRGVQSARDAPVGRWRDSAGSRSLDGLSMLVYQGMIGFELWTGQAAPEDVMKEALTNALGV